MCVLSDFGLVLVILKLVRHNYSNAQRTKDILRRIWGGPSPFVSLTRR